MAATATDIQSFKEKNDQLFAKVLEMNAFVQQEYDALTHSMENGEFDNDLTQQDSRRMSLRAPVRPLSSAQRFQVKVDDRKL